MFHPHRRSQLARLCALAALATLGIGATTGAHAQGSYPNKPIKLVVPYPAGGGVDAIARRLAQGLGTQLGQQVIVDNRPGGNLIIATRYVAQAEPDGYTLHFTVSQPYTMNQFFFKSLPYDPEKAFTPVATVSAFTTGLQVAADSPFKTLQDYVQYVKAHPGKLNFGSAGATSQARLAMDMFNDAAGLQMMHVAYQGGAPASVALMAKETQSMFMDHTSTSPYIKAGKMRTLAVNYPTRVETLPGVPTFAEAGYPNLNIPLVWTGLMAPPHTPPAIVNRLAEAVRKEVTSAEMKRFFNDFSLIALPGGPAEVNALIRKDIDGWGGMIKKLGITIE